MRRETMVNTIDKERIIYKKDMEYIDCYESENSDDLSLARGIFNGFIIELFAAAAFVVVVITLI
jgi:hypothetical protein